jgi:predicted nucleotidyltransferase
MKILYKIKSGSHLYGLTTPNSDLDYVGVYIEDTVNEHLNIFNNKDEFDASVVSKLANGKNTSDAVDEKYFHIKKFLKLCADCNPNILELLFCPKDCIEYVDPLFKALILNHPEMFINQKLISRFIGYAKSQEQKSYTKSNNYLLLEKFKLGLENFLYSESRKTIKDIATSEDFIDAFNNNFKVIEKHHTLTNIESVLILAEMEFPFGLLIKEALQRVNDRFNRASHRVDGILINRYEPKFLSHTIRLLVEGSQLLTTQKIEFPLSGEDKKAIMDIKLGVTPIEDIPDVVNFYKNKLQKLEEENINNIPKNADYNKINEAYMSIILSSYNICIM